MEFLKKNWMQIFAPALCVILLAAVLWQNQKFDALKEELASLSEALEQQEMQTGDLRQQARDLAADSRVFRMVSAAVRLSCTGHGYETCAF